MFWEVRGPGVDCRPLSSDLADLSLALLSWELLTSLGLLEPCGACDPKEPVDPDYL